MVCISLTEPQELLQMVEGDDGEATTGNKLDKDKARTLSMGGIPEAEGEAF